MYHNQYTSRTGLGSWSQTWKTLCDSAEILGINPQDYDFYSPSERIEALRTDIQTAIKVLAHNLEATKREHADLMGRTKHYERVLEELTGNSGDELFV